MDVKKVSALLTAIEKGSLTSAAAELGYTQSGLTHMMNTLEAELGLNLLVRSKNGVHLSPAGQELLPDMRALVEAAAALESSADKLRMRDFSTLRLGTYSSIARQWLPSVLAEFRCNCPDTDVNINVCPITEIYDGVRGDEFDCALASYQEALCQGVNWIPLMDDALVAVLPASWEQMDSFPLQNFDGKEFLMPSLGFDQDILSVFEEYGVHPDIRNNTSVEDAAIVSMVEHGLGVSILSELVLEGLRMNVRTLPLDPPACRPIGIAVASREDATAVVQQFIAYSRRIVGQLHQ